MTSSIVPEMPAVLDIEPTTMSTKVLLIQESRVTEPSIAQRIKDSGYALDSIASVDAAKEHLQDSSYSCIVLHADDSDTCLNFIHWLEQQALDTPIILTSASNLSLALKRDFSDYVSIDSELSSTLPNAIQQLINQHETNYRIREAEAALAHLSQQHELILTTIDDGVCGIDLSGTITFINPAGAEILGIEPASVLGEPIDRLFNRHIRASHISQEHLREHQELQFTDNNGEKQWLEYCIKPIEQNGVATSYVLSYRDIGKYKQTEIELQAAKDMALEASRMKSEFLANMSHEIRTPLNGIIGLTQLTLDTPLNDEQTKNLKMVMNSSDLLLALINDLLDFSKIEAGKLELEAIPFSFDDEMQTLVELNRINAEAKGLVFSYQVNGDVPLLLLGDPNRLKQVLFNLINNAVKFTHEGEVTCQVDVLSTINNQVTLKIKVTDTGIGIPPDKQKLIFDPFTQADRTMTRKYGGTGLGLAISMHLLSFMESQLNVSSQLGKGSTFEFTLTLPIASSQLSEAPQEKEHSGALEPVNQALNLLLVEDSRVNRLLATKMLENKGHQVTVAEDGKQAIELWRAEGKTGRQFDLILMDMQMPVMDGVNATRCIRTMESNGRQQRTAIVALTANAFDEERQKCIDAGMDGFVTKPINPDLLFESIGRALMSVAAYHSRN